MSDERNDRRNSNWGKPEKRKGLKEREENNWIEREKKEKTKEREEQKPK